MSTKKALFLDPYDSETIRELSEIGDYKDIVDFITRTRNFTPELYNEIKKGSNEIEEILYLKEDNKIKDYCHIYGEKDRKIGTITFSITGVKRKSFIPMIINCTQELGIKEVFIKTTPEDKVLIKDLDDLGFESLGEDNGIVIYLKEEELEKEVQRKRQ